MDISLGTAGTSNDPTYFVDVDPQMGRLPGDPPRCPWCIETRRHRHMVGLLSEFGLRQSPAPDPEKSRAGE